MTEKRISIPSQARSREAKERIIQAAFELFGSHSIMDITIKMIADRADVAIGSLYVYFKDKSDITKAVLERYNELFLTMDYTNIINSEPDITLAIERILTELLNNLNCGNIPFIEMQLLQSKDPEVQELIESFNEKILDLAKKIITSTTIPLRQKDTDIAAAYVFLMVDSYLFRWPYYRKVIDMKTMTHEAALAISAYLFGTKNGN